MDGLDLSLRYRAVSLLNSGYFATIFSAERLLDSRNIVLKVVNKSSSEQKLEEFRSCVSILDEPELQLCCAHPNILACLKHFNSEEFLCMELEIVLEGDLKKNLLETGALSSQLLSFFFRHMLLAVQFLRRTLTAPCHRINRIVIIVIMTKAITTMILHVLTLFCLPYQLTWL